MFLTKYIQPTAFIIQRTRILYRCDARFFSFFFSYCIVFTEKIVSLHAKYDELKMVNNYYKTKQTMQQTSIIQSDLNDAERDVLGASALAWEVPEYSLFK